MSNQPSHSSTPGHWVDDAVSSTSRTHQLDEDALRAFVRAAEAGTLNDCDPGTVSAAVDAVRTLLEPTDDTIDDTGTTTPPESKWAEAAGCDLSTEAPTTPTPPEKSTQAVDHELLPVHIELVDARAAYEAVIEYLDDSGPAMKREIVTDVMPSYPLGYTPPAPGEHVGNWWYSVIQPALSTDSTVSYQANAGYMLGE